MGEAAGKSDMVLKIPPLSRHPMALSLHRNWPGCSFLGRPNSSSICGGQILLSRSAPSAPFTQSLSVVLTLTRPAFSGVSGHIPMKANKIHSQYLTGSIRDTHPETPPQDRRTLQLLPQRELEKPPTMGEQTYSVRVSRISVQYLK